MSWQPSHTAPSNFSRRNRQGSEDGEIEEEGEILRDNNNNLENGNPSSTLPAAVSSGPTSHTSRPPPPGAVSSVGNFPPPQHPRGGPPGGRRPSWRGRGFARPPGRGVPRNASFSGPPPPPPTAPAQRSQSFSGFRGRAIDPRRRPSIEPGSYVAVLAEEGTASETVARSIEDDGGATRGPPPVNRRGGGDFRTGHSRRQGSDFRGPPNSEPPFPRGPPPIDRSMGNEPPTQQQTFRGPPPPERNVEPPFRAGPQTSSETPPFRGAPPDRMVSDPHFRGGHEPPPFRGATHSSERGSHANETHQTLRGGPSEPTLFRGSEAHFQGPPSTTESSQFRGPSSEPGFRGPPPAANEPPFRDDFRRSPATRGRPLFGRGGPAPQRMGAPFPRRQDPRFHSTKPEEHPRDSSPPQDTILPPPASSMDRTFPPERNFQRSSFTENTPDTFARSRDWNRPPQESSQNKKTIINSSYSDDHAKAPPFSRGSPPPPQEISKPSSQSVAPEAPEVTEETTVLTSKLGEENVGRAENIIGVLAEVMNRPMLKAHEGNLSELPTKQLILQAVAKMDTRIRNIQRETDEKEEKLQTTLQEEKKAQRIDELEALARNKQLEEELKREEESRRNEEARQIEKDIQLLMEERQDELKNSEGKAKLEFKEQLTVRQDEVEKEIELEMQQVAEKKKDDYDHKAHVLRDELQKVSQDCSITEEKLLSNEEKYHNMRAVIASSSDTTVDTISNIIMENKRRAGEAHLEPLSTGNYIVSDDDLPHNHTSKVAEMTDPKEGRTTAEWFNLTQRVTGFKDALYTEPCEAPFYDVNEENHASIRELVTAFVYDRQRRLQSYWTELAEEYDYRKDLHEVARKERQAIAGEKRKSIIPRINPLVPILESTTTRTTTNTANPYRRARRGNEVRSEYEQEQIIAEIASKEAIEKKIAFGGCKIPRQVGYLERTLSARFVKTFTTQKIADPLEEERLSELTNIWSDMEKCIFLDRFMQHPKDFRKISTFLRNKNARDCVEFYYDSKQYVPYKSALKEHFMRRKRRGDYQVWGATIQAATSVGAVVEAGPNEEKPVIFLLPESDHTFRTMNLHPLKREILDSFHLDESVIEALDEEEDTLDRKGQRTRKRQREPLFELDPERTKFLKETPPPTSDTQSLSHESTAAKVESTPIRRAPQKWTPTEKRIFIETLEKHGRNWSILSEAVGTKTISQIKNFYYDYKKQSGRQKDKKSSDGAKPRSSTEEDDATVTPEETSLASGLTNDHLERAEPSSLNPRGIIPSALDSSQEVRQERSEELYGFADPALQRSLQLAALEDQLRNETRLPVGSGNIDNISQHDLWAQAQLLMNHSQGQITDETARQLLQQHSQDQLQRQQLLSSFLPWLSSTQQGQQQSRLSPHHLQELAMAQALQSIHMHQPQGSHQIDPLSTLSSNPHLRSLGLSGLGNLDASMLQRVLHQRNQGLDETQLAIAQQLLGYNRDASAESSLNLLARAMGMNDSSYHGSDSKGPAGDYFHRG